jgi:hypothetical protein
LFKREFSHVILALWIDFRLKECDSAQPRSKNFFCATANNAMSPACALAYHQRRKLA